MDDEHFAGDERVSRLTAEYEVRQSALEDLDELAGLFNLYRIFYGQRSALEQAREFLFERMEHRESILFHVRDRKSRRMAGFIQLYPAFSSVSMKRTFILNDLYVLEEYRGQGIGRLLLDEARRYAGQLRAKGLELSTAAGNAAAQRLYEQCGYARDEQFVHYFLSLED